MVQPQRGDQVLMATRTRREHLVQLRLDRAHERVRIPDHLLTVIWTG